LLGKNLLLGVKMTKQVLYIDMDDTIVDFRSSTRIPDHEKEVYGHPAMYQEGFFRDLLPFPTAIQAVNRLIDSGKYDVWILTQPVADSPRSYSEKAEWVIKHLPRLTHKIKMTQEKTMCLGAILIDDNPKWAGFFGDFYLFDRHNPEATWSILLNQLL
jgi:5'-nucleotidase